MSAVTSCRHNPERRAASSHRSTAFSASGTLANTRANLAMLEYASTDARGEDSASNGRRVARKHLADESKKASSWYTFARHMRLWAIAPGWPHRSATATAALRVRVASPNLPKPL